jgi:hypothetical protein
MILNAVHQYTHIPVHLSLVTSSLFEKSAYVSHENTLWARRPYLEGQTPKLIHSRYAPVSMRAEKKTFQ